MSISAAQVKQLRERTGAGMMECKRALEATDGDMQAAVEKMRTEGLAKADKKAGRVAAEGLVALQEAQDTGDAVMIEVNCETDFVALGDDFRNFVVTAAQLVLEHDPADVETLYGLGDEGSTLDDQRRELVARIGENINVRRFVRVAAEGRNLSAYTHGGRIGAVVVVEGGDAALARDVALHVAAANPRSIHSDDLPAEEVEKERGILVAQAKESGKPDHIVEKMVEGRLRKHLQEITLTDQPFVKDPEQSVGELLKAADARVVRFERFELGAGIATQEEDFAAEVQAQIENVK